MSKTKFFVCRHCGNLMTLVNDSGVPVKCCGENMQELVANSTDAAGEKHVPVVSVDGNTISITVGSVAHPMADEHYIEWIYLETEKGGQIKHLKPGEEPRASFVLENDEPVGAYAFCNLHGLWYGA